MVMVDFKNKQTNQPKMCIRSLDWCILVCVSQRVIASFLVLVKLVKFKRLK